MSPAHRGSVKELSFLDPSVEPLHEMEELFDLLESIRKADLNAPCFDTDAHALKEVMAKEHSLTQESDDHGDRSRTDEFIAHTTALRKASHVEASESYSTLYRNSQFDSQPQTRKETYEEAKRLAQELEVLLKRLKA